MRILLCALLAVLGQEGSAAAQLPASTLRLTANLERVLTAKKAELATDIAHYGLVFQPTDDQFRAFLKDVEARDQKGGIVVTRRQFFDASHYATRENHGGTILYDLLRFWRPDGRTATLQDQYVFANGQRRLGDIYAAHKKQVLLRPPEAGAPPFLPAMALPFVTDDGRTIVEQADAYQMLLLLIDQTPADHFGDQWVNLFGQTLSVDLLMEQVRTAYLTDRGMGTLSGMHDHSSYHVIEMLVQHARKTRVKPDIEAIKKRFLGVELSATADLKARNGYALASHYTQSLGYLLSYERLELTPGEKTQITAWLGALAGVFPGRLDQVDDIHELAHALHGLRLIHEHERTLR